MPFHRSFYVNFMRFSRMILKLCMKKAPSEGLITDKCSFEKASKPQRLSPTLSGQQSQEFIQRMLKRSAGRQDDTEMPLLQKLIPKLGICTLLLPKLLCEWPQQSAPRMKQMEEEVQPARNAFCLRREMMVMHTPACPKTVCQLPQFKYCLVQLHICVSTDRVHLTRSSKDLGHCQEWGIHNLTGAFASEE